jgi:hypothetical protein
VIPDVTPGQSMDLSERPGITDLECGNKDIGDGGPDTLSRPTLSATESTPSCTDAT